MTDSSSIRLKETGQLVDRTAAPAMPANAARGVPEISTPKPWRLRLQISANQDHHTLGIDVKDTILIGRITNTPTDYQVDLDLEPYGGGICGVSRRHAQILNVEELLFIEDLHSTNGTRLNGFELKPAFRYRLNDGDDLHFGTLRLVIRFVKSPLAQN